MNLITRNSMQLVVGARVVLFRFVHGMRPYDTLGLRWGISFAWYTGLDRAINRRLIQLFYETRPVIEFRKQKMQTRRFRFVEFTEINKPPFVWRYSRNTSDSHSIRSFWKFEIQTNKISRISSAEMHFSRNFLEERVVCPVGIFYIFYILRFFRFSLRISQRKDGFKIEEML